MFGTAEADQLLDQQFNGEDSTIPEGIDIGLWIGSPGAAGVGGAEVSGGGYLAIPTIALDWSTAANGVITNVTEIAFDEATAYWGEITHIALFAIWSGVRAWLMYYGSLTTAKEVDEGSIVKFKVGTLSIILL